MFPLKRKPQLSHQEMIEKVFQLKPKFDCITNYSEKLNFWYTNGFNIGVYTFGITDELDKRDLPENFITIYPKNNEEKIIYKKFYYDVFTKENINTLQSSIVEYWKQIGENGANPIPYTKKLIAEIEKHYKSENKFPDTGNNAFRSYCNGYDASENGQVQDFLNNASFHNHLYLFLIGEVHEKFKRFLVKQLQLLENAKPGALEINTKLNISYKLIGENKSNSVSPVFHHVKDVLSHYKITPTEAKEILLDMQGANSPQMNTNVVEPVVKYLDGITDSEFKIGQPQQSENQFLQGVYTIKDFENFIYGCNGILVNANGDIIEWQPHFTKELWEKNSFLANGKMKTAQRVWNENGDKIYSNAHISKTNIKHIILVEQNTVVIQYLKNEIEKICNTLTKFRDDNNMLHCDIAPKNPWFKQLWYLVIDYKEWFDELIKPIEKSLPLQQAKNELETEIKADEIKQPLTSTPQLNEPIYDTKIFTEYRGFQIFEAFKNEIITEATEYADYSFLFNKLKKDNLIHDLKHKKFISYLSKNHNSLLESKGYKQFKFSTTALKNKTYSRFKKQFQ